MNRNQGQARVVRIDEWQNTGHQSEPSHGVPVFTRAELIRQADQAVVNDREKVREHGVKTTRALYFSAFLSVACLGLMFCCIKCSHDLLVFGVAFAIVIALGMCPWFIHRENLLRWQKTLGQNLRHLDSLKEGGHQFT